MDLVDSAFPASVLPFIVDDDFVDMCRDTLKDTKYVWCGDVPNTSEPQLATFLNKICEAIAEASGQEILREWDAKYCNTALPGSPIR